MNKLKPMFKYVRKPKRLMLWYNRKHLGRTHTQMNGWKTAWPPWFQFSSTCSLVTPMYRLRYHHDSLSMPPAAQVDEQHCYLHDSSNTYITYSRIKIVYNPRGDCGKTYQHYAGAFDLVYVHFDLKGPILYCVSSISHSCHRSNNTVFDMHCPKPICGHEFQLSKCCSSELYWEQAVSVPAPLNANELHLSMPALPGTGPSQGEDATYPSGSMC